MTLRKDPAVNAERVEATARRPGDPIGNTAAYVTAFLAIEDSSVDLESARKAVAAYAARMKGKGQALAELLGKLADEKMGSAQEQQAAYLAIVNGFPGTPAAQLAAARLAQLDEEKFRSVVDPGEANDDPRVGRPFEFAFQDAVSGELVSSAGLRGHVLVIDFWATWCPPCVAAVPKMKDLYEKYAPDGVMFIGVSLDEPGQAGRRKLLDFVAANQVPWAQYHQANGELSKAWNVTGIPSVFVIDQAGRVVTTRGNLDEVIPQLLDDGPAKKPAPAEKPATEAKRKASGGKASSAGTANRRRS
jgi:thiol-disulfide isomerase/thioredoxin